MPALIWTAGDNVIQFASQGLLQPVDGFVDMEQFLPVAAEIVRYDGRTFGIPLQVGNHLMLFYNKKIVSEAPRTFAELVKVAQNLQKAHLELSAPFMYNQWDAYWAFPVAHAFGATAFDPSGKVPALDTDEWVKAYQLLHDLKYVSKIELEDCDYECADAGFKNGTTAIILNGDWALNGNQGYVTVLGDNLGIAPWPAVGSDPTHDIPSPYIVGTFLAIPSRISGDKLQTAQAFAKFWATDAATALSWTVSNRRLSALLAAFNSDSIGSDPILSQTSKILLTGRAMPVQPEMQCVMPSVRKYLQLLLADSSTPVDAAKSAQKAALDCIAKLKA